MSNSMLVPLEEEILETNGRSVDTEGPDDRSGSGGFSGGGSGGGDGNRAGSGSPNGNSAGSSVRGTAPSVIGGTASKPRIPLGAIRNASRGIVGSEPSTGASNSGTGAGNSAVRDGDRNSGSGYSAGRTDNSGSGTNDTGAGAKAKRLLGLDRDTLKPKAIGLPKPFVSKGKGKGKALALSQNTVEHGLCALFGGIAVATKHRHWVKKTDELTPISGPLTRMLNSLPAEVIDRLERHADPLLLCWGIYQVCGKDIAIERELRKLEKENRKESVASTGNVPLVMPNGAESNSIDTPISAIAPPPDL